MKLVRDHRVLFICVGIVNTVVGLGWFIFFSSTTGTKLGYMTTLLFTHVLSVLSAFILYRKLVFKVRGHLFRDLFRFESVNLAALAINALLLPIFVSFLKFEVIPAQFIIVIITTLFSYLGHNYFSFSRRT